MQAFPRELVRRRSETWSQTAWFERVAKPVRLSPTFFHPLNGIFPAKFSRLRGERSYETWNKRRVDSTELVSRFVHRGSDLSTSPKRKDWRERNSREHARSRGQRCVETLRLGEKRDTSVSFLRRRFIHGTGVIRSAKDSKAERRWRKAEEEKEGEGPMEVTY